jgi:hypothetical protein
LPDSADALRRTIDGPALHALGIRIRDDAALYALEICRLAQDNAPWASR